MTTLTPDELNRRLAGLLGMDLTARKPGDPLYTYTIDTESGHITYSHELPPPDYAGDLVTVFGIVTDVRDRGLQMRYLAYLIDITGLDTLSGQEWFEIIHASAYNRGLAAYRALGGEEENDR